MPDLKCYFLLACRAFPRVICNKIEVFHPEFITILLLGIITVGDVNNVILNILLHNEPGSSSQSQSFSLANGMKPIAADEYPIFLPVSNSITAPLFSQKATDKIVIIYLAQKQIPDCPSDGHWAIRPATLSHALHASSAHLSETTISKPANSQSGPEISLIFYRVLGCTQPGFPAQLQGRSIMSGCRKIEIFSDPLLETAKLNQLVTHHIRIRSLPFRIFSMA